MRHYYIDLTGLAYIGLTRARKAGVCVYESEKLETARQVALALLDLATILNSRHGETSVTLCLDADVSWRKGWLEQWFADRELEPNCVYKGNREQRWDLLITKTEFKLLAKQVAHSLASVLGWSVSWAEGWEADDIAAYHVDKLPSGAVARLISDDSDWDQLTIGHDKKIIRFDLHLVRKSDGYTHRDLLAKVISGDDGIKGVPKNATQCYAISGAYTLLDSKGVAPIVDNQYFQRNLTLIVLDPTHFPPSQVITVSPTAKDSLLILKACGLNDLEITRYRMQGLLK